MTSRERLLGALRREPVDRVPIWAWGIHPWLGTVHPTIQPVVEAYLDRADLMHWWSPGSGTFLSASEQVTVRVEDRDCELPDYRERVLVYSTPAGELTEVHYVSARGRPGYCKKHLLGSEADVEALLSVPYVPVQPDCSGFREVDRELGERGLPIVSLGSDPMYLLNNLTGSELFAVWSIEKRGLIGELIAEFLRREKAWVEWLLAQGVGPLFGYVGPELCIPPLQSPRDFEEWVVGPDREINDLIRRGGGLSLVHCHGRMGPVLEGFVRMHADALHPIEPPPMGDVTLAEAKARVGADLCIVGNVQEHDLLTMPTSQFRALVRETVRVGTAGGGFILSPTATPFGWPELSDLGSANWLALLEVGSGAGECGGAVR
ncbi:MAG: hypothetical protein FJX74_12955 [Armatimonadetes bacterium]|nr:hypothetical protein [Armatimonadota bacterium]